MTGSIRRASKQFPTTPTRSHKHHVIHQIISVALFTIPCGTSLTTHIIIPGQMHSSQIRIVSICHVAVSDWSIRVDKGHNALRREP